MPTTPTPPNHPQKDPSPSPTGKSVARGNYSISKLAIEIDKRQKALVADPKHLAEVAAAKAAFKKKRKAVKDQMKKEAKAKAMGVGPRWFDKVKYKDKRVNRVRGPKAPKSAFKIGRLHFNLRTGRDPND